VRSFRVSLEEFQSSCNLAADRVSRTASVLWWEQLDDPKSAARVSVHCVQLGCVGDCLRIASHGGILQSGLDVCDRFLQASMMRERLGCVQTRRIGIDGTSS
jgi:hypothetical protein